MDLGTFRKIIITYEVNFNNNDLKLINNKLPDIQNGFVVINAIDKVDA